MFIFPKMLFYMLFHYQRHSLNIYLTAIFLNL